MVLGSVLAGKAFWGLALYCAHFIFRKSKNFYAEIIQQLNKDQPLSVVLEAVFQKKDSLLLGEKVLFVLMSFQVRW